MHHHSLLLRGRAPGARAHARACVRAVALALAGVAALASLASCGIGDIDRTQPNKIRKSTLAGEWLSMQTVIDVPYSTSFTFIGEQSEKAERLRWDIQEQFLIGYRAYDLVDGTDRPSNVPGFDTNKVPLAIFPIVSHFDVQREYNAQTGEQTNVISENTVDRPWYDREWMRVDWSRNLAPNFDFLVGNVTQVPGAHFVQDPRDADSLIFSVRNGDGTWSDAQGDAIAALTSADYFDVVHRTFATPETVLLEDWDGTIYEEPACWYYGWFGYGAADCAPAEISIRSSFLKVDPANPYVPKEYPDNLVLRDGNGEAIRVDYVDRDTLAPSADGFIARAPFFDKFGYFRTEREAYDRRHGETHSGKVFLINRFNIWLDAPACVNEGAAAPYAGCTVKPIVYYTSPGFPAELRTQAQITVDGWNEAFKRTVNKLKYNDARALADVEDVVVLRDNTYKLDAGGVLDRGQRLGDLRFNMLAWVDNPNLAGLLGYGPSAADPTTGEIVQASAFMYGAGIDSLAQNGKEVVDLTNDPTLFEEYISGEDVQLEVYRRRVDNARAREDGQRFAREKVNSPRNKALRKLGKNALRRDGGSMRARLDAVRDTPLEQRLMSDPIRRAWATAHGTDANGAGRRELSPSSWAMGQAAHRERLRRKHLEKHNVTHSRYFDTSVIAVADELKDLPADERFAELRRRIFRSTAEHEMGHNFGLRHNFEASTDALNYGRGYWDLKGTGGQALEPPTAAQLAGGIREHQYASIMDYGSRFMSDIHGLGLYDQAAIAFGYGDLVEVFAGEPQDNLLELYTLQDLLLRRHYTKLPQIFGGIAAMHDRRLEHYSTIVDQLAGRASWDLWEVPYRFCSDEYEGANATCAVFDEGADAFEIADAARRQYVEYFPFLAFSRDRRYFNEWDYMWGIQSRVFWPMLTQYQNFVFNSFFEESFYDCIVSNEDGCDFQRLADDARYFNLDPVPWAESDDGGLAGAAASRLLLDTIAEVVAQPEPGSYFFDGAEELQVLYSYFQDPVCPPGVARPDCSELNVALGEGRFTESQWDVESGYTFYDRLMMVGSFYDKLVAIETAVMSDTYFLGVDTGADVGRFAIGLSLFFPEEIHRIVGGTSAEDYRQFAGVMCTADRRYIPPSVSLPNPDPCNGGPSQLVDPATSFTIELYSIWYGMAFLPFAFDLDYNDRMKIWLDGSGEAIEPADPSLVVTFANPLNNRVYKATRSADPSVYSPGAALLERAQRFADAYVQQPSLENRFRLENLVITIEDVRGTYQIYGTFYF
jgi:hypothetical protein